MSNWNLNTLKEMTETDNTYLSIKLNYEFIAKEYENILIDTYQDGNIEPTLFKDVELAYNGNIKDDITLPEISEDKKENIELLNKNRKVVELKHFSRDLSHPEWFKHLEDEVIEFIEKYPKYKNVIKS